MAPLDHVIALSAALFALGAVGVFTRRNLVVILMCIELMLNGVVLAFVAFNRAWPAGIAGESRLDGQVFALVIIAVAAAELAVGLGIVIALVRNRASLDVEDVSLLKW
ncbi:MAG: NADH-quinone oxidoreductase subunit NuoK [Deltaproteobacteria bacterium]|nr:NADH-quinone oxidoreductase subunit NuoK [Deltaproteobacteria bacterium]MBW2417533.1 NADH-quinone oxidoreductase subunit NuoK [Deltaproteobacteria bacterium]